jgi:hypothetical protein
LRSWRSRSSLRIAIGTGGSSNGQDSGTASDNQGPKRGAVALSGRSRTKSRGPLGRRSPSWLGNFRAVRAGARPRHGVSAVKEKVRRAILKVFPDLALLELFQPPPPKPKREYSRCGAKTRRGSPCQARSMPNGRCKLHGGMSTGARTKAGKRRVAEARARRWARWRAERENGGD